jgi:hypothetical protein
VFIFSTVLAWLGKLLGGPFAKAAVDAYRAKLSAENTTDKTAAELKSRELELDNREAAINAQTVQVEQGNWITRWVRPAWAFPFVAYAWKAVLWDKVVMGNWHGSTDPLAGDMQTAMSIIIVGYFGARGAQYIVREWKKRLG